MTRAHATYCSDACGLVSEPTSDGYGCEYIADEGTARVVMNIVC